MNTIRERAMELFKQGYNCSQSVFGAFCEECDMDFIDKNGCIVEDHSDDITKDELESKIKSLLSD